MDEFVLRFSANWSNVKSELGRAGSYIKAWGTTLVEDFKSKIGRMFIASVVLDKAFEQIEKIRDKILSIKRMENDLPGIGTNFLQGMANYAERIGVNFEKASKPLLKFKSILDAAKMNPGGPELKLLERYNIVMSQADLKTQSFAESMAKLSEEYLKSGKNLKVVQSLLGAQGGAPSEELLTFLELGPDKLRGMGKGNFFTKLTGGNLAFYNRLFPQATGVGQVVTATLGNILGSILRIDPVLKSIGMVSRTLGQLRHPLNFLKHPMDAAREIMHPNNDADVAEEKLRENLQQEQQKNDLVSRRLELLEREKELTSAINDANKTSVEQGAALARKLTGTLEPKLYSMTPRLRTMLKIDQLKKQSRVEQLRGNDSLSESLMNQAQKLALQSPFLMDKDREPFRKVSNDLDTIKGQLQVVADMADMVNHDAKKGAGFH